MPNLTDDQRRAICHDYGDVMVSASAGSGKTFVMIERIIRLIIERKARVKEILATTFTEMAAAEMKEKLKKALINKINASDSETADYLVRELGDVSTADISTVHAFCARLIRTYFFNVGLAPDFAICDEEQAKELKRNAVDKVFKNFYDSQDQGFLTLVSRYQVKRADGWFKDEIIRLFNYCQTAAQPQSLLDASEKFYSEESQKELVNQFLTTRKNSLRRYLTLLDGAIETFTKSQRAKSLAFTNLVKGDLEFILGTEDVYAISKLANEYNRTLSFEQKMQGEELLAKDAVTACRDQIKECLASVRKIFVDSVTDKNRLETLREHTHELTKIIRAFEEEYSKLKREENLLDFNDLEHFSIKILTDPLIRDSVREKYKFIFVDEYQDTNGVQELLYSLISNDNLFAVGDVKQSIYGFRGCRPEIFSNRFESMQNSGKATVTLNANFRSSPKVIEMVNDIFSFSMTKDLFGIDYENSSKLVYGGGYKDQDGKEHLGRATLHFLESQTTEKASERARVYDILEEIKKQSANEASNVSKLLADVITKEFGQEYFDLKESRLKRVNYKDICILTRNKDNDYVQGIVKGLKRHGIPVVSEVAENLFDYPEVLSLIAVLKLLDSYNDDVALATVLKSPLCALTDEDLYEISRYYLKNAGETIDRNRTFYDTYRFYLEHAQGQLLDKLLAFNKYVDELKTLADFTSAYSVMDKVVRDFSIEARLYATEEGERKVMRLRRFINASVVGDKHLSVKAFLDLLSRDGAEIKFAGVNDDNNAVKVMTIHASKGLEFPVVIVCGLERKANAREESEQILCDREFGFAVKYYDDQNKTRSETLNRAIIKDKMAINRIREELRLFYVATTRASYSLHLTFESSEDERKERFDGATKFLHYVPKTIPYEQTKLSDLEGTHFAKPMKKILFGTPDEGAVHQINQNLNYAYAYQSDTLLPLKSSVTEALNENNQSEYYSVNELFSEESTNQTGRERGIIAHKYLENFDFGLRKSPTLGTEKIVNDKIMTEDELSQIDLEKIGKALASPIFEGAEYKSIYREQSFLVTLPADKVFKTDSKSEILLQGVIDLLIDDGDSYRIIDYKYSSLSAERLKEKYKKQLDLYALAVTKITGKRVTQKAIFSLLNGELVVIE